MVHIFNPAVEPGGIEGLVSKIANCPAGKDNGHWLPVEIILSLPTRGAQNN